MDTGKTRKGDVCLLRYSAELTCSATRWPLEMLKQVSFTPLSDTQSLKALYGTRSWHKHNVLVFPTRSVLSSLTVSLQNLRNVDEEISIQVDSSGCKGNLHHDCQRVSRRELQLTLYSRTGTGLASATAMKNSFRACLSFPKTKE